MSGFMTHETALKITGPDGTLLHIGIGPLGMVYEVMMVSQAVNAGQVICAQGANCVVPRMDYVAADVASGESAIKQKLVGVIGTAVVTLGPTLGVAIDKCASDAAGVQIRVAGKGSVVATESTANGTLGQYCLRAAAGQVTPAATISTALIECGWVLKVGNLSGGSGTKIGMLVS